MSTPRPPALILQHALDYIGARYGGTLAHHIIAKAKEELAASPRCTICDCERVPLDRAKSEFGACTNIECRDPLYDYRGENPYKSVPKPAEGVAAPLEPSTELETVIAKFADFVRNCGIADEGQGLNEFSQTHNNALAIVIGEMLDPQDNVPLVEALQAYAAAVSKNLQEELTDAKKDLTADDRDMFAIASEIRCDAVREDIVKGIRKFKSRISELEKEITALRLELCDRDKQVKGLAEDAVRLIEQAGKSPH